MTTRNAGVLLHPTSLPGRYGIGDLGDELVTFLDWARSAGMKIWQLLPLNPPGYGNSPYGCHSSYAGNPLVDVDVFELEGCSRPVPSARQEREGDEGTVAAFNIGAGRHLPDDVPDLLQRRHTGIAMRLGDPCFLG